METLETDKKTIFQFFAKPSIGIIGTIASVIGIFLSVYFYLASREKPELTYYVHPAKAAVFRTGQTSNIEVQLEGKKLKNDITAAQIAFWNAGKKSIRPNNVLSPLVIKIDGQIFEAKLRKSSRSVSQINVDPSRIKDGEVEITWGILEHNDGGVLQIIYDGKEDLAIKANAIIEGQQNIKELSFNKMFSIFHGKENNSSLGLGSKLFTYAVMILMASTIPFVLYKCFIKGYLGSKSEWALFFFQTALVSAVIWFMLGLIPPDTPFSF